MSVQKVFFPKNKGTALEFKWFAPHIALNQDLGEQMGYYPVNDEGEQIPWQEGTAAKSTEKKRNPVAVADEHEIKDYSTDGTITTDKEEENKNTTEGVGVSPAATETTETETSVVTEQKPKAKKTKKASTTN